MDQKQFLMQFEKDFQIERKLFLNLNTGWFDNSRDKSNLVSAKDISVEHIQGRYRLNLKDNKLRTQEFFFDLEWSPFTQDGKAIEVLTKEIVDSYFPRLKRAAKKLLFILLKYIPKEYIYIRASGSGLHILFFFKGLRDMDEWQLITQYLIVKSKLPNTKNAAKLLFGLDKDTILSSERKTSEFGSWNKLKKELKREVEYLNYATYISVDEFFRAKHYPFCPDFNLVEYPDKYRYLDVPPNLLKDAKQSSIHVQTNTTPPIKELTNKKKQNNEPFKGTIPDYDPATAVMQCPAYWGMLRSKETEWYERHFLMKFLKYALNLNREQIIELVDRYNCWSDYNRQTTLYYINKHFREGTCETKVKKPVRKATLVKYGLCKDDCKGCVYGHSIGKKNQKISTTTFFKSKIRNHKSIS